MVLTLHIGKAHADFHQRPWLRALGDHHQRWLHPHCEERWQSVTLRVWLKRIWSDYLYHQRYTFLFEKLIHKNSINKCAYCGEILWQVTSWEVSQTTFEREWSTLERLVMICGVSRGSLKLFLITIYGLSRDRGVTDGIRANPRP